MPDGSIHVWMNTTNVVKKEFHRECIRCDIKQSYVDGEWKNE